MKKGIRPATLLFFSLIAAAPATRPTTGPTVDALPAGAVLRLGDDRFAIGGRPGDGDFSPDGRRFATAAGVAQVWDCATGRPVWSGTPDQGLAQHVAYVSDDELAVYCQMATGPMIRICDARRGDVLRSFRAETEGSGVESMAVSPDGNRLVTNGHRLALYDPRAGRLVADLGPGHSTAGNPTVPATASAQFSADSTRLRAIMPDGRTADFDAAAGTPISDEPALTAPAGATWSADGRTAAVGNDQGLGLFDVPTAARVPWPSRPPPATRPAAARPAAPRPDVATVTPAAAGSGTTRPIARRVPRVVDIVARFGFSPADNHLALVLSGTNPRVLLWDTSVRPPAGPVEIPCQSRRVRHLAWSRDGRRIALVDNVGRPELIDVVARRPLFDGSAHVGPITAIAPSPDGRTVALGGYRSLDLWDLATGRRLAVATAFAGGPPGSLAFDPAGRSILSVGSGGIDRIVRLDAGSLAPLPVPPIAVRTWPGIASVSGIQFSADGRFAVDQPDGSTLRVQDVGSGQTVWRSPRFPSSGRVACAVDNDGKTVAAMIDSVLRIYRAGKDPAELLGRPPSSSPMGPVHLRFSPDGHHLFGGWQSGFGIWDLDDTLGVTDVAALPPNDGTSDGLADPGAGVPGARTIVPSSEAYNAAFSADGNLLAVTVYGGIPFDVAPPPLGSGTDVYEVSTGQRVASFRGHSGRMSQVAFVPGRPYLLITGSQDGTALVWDLRRALRAEPVDGRRTDDQLWADVGADDAGVGYRAALELDDRGRLAAHAPRPAATRPSQREVFRRLIAELSSPDHAAREAAHRKLEQAGAAAGPDVRAALAAHPGGETEARLADLARLADAAGLPPEMPAGEADGVRRDAARSRRAAVVLEWRIRP